MFTKFKEYVENYRNYRINKKKTKLIKKVVSLSIFLLLFFAGLRAYSLYNYHNDTMSQDKIVNNAINKTTKRIVKEFLLSTYQTVYYHNQSDAYHLQSNLLENHGADKVYDSLVNGNYSEDVYQTFIDTFSSLYHEGEMDESAMVIVANDEGILYLKSNNRMTKFANMKQNENLISWETFLNEMGDSKIMAEAFANAYYKPFTNNPVVIRIDGEFEDGEYYTIDDLAVEYIKNGVDGVRGYGFLVCSTITEKGDMYGNIDNLFMEKNDDVHKLYVFHYIDAAEYFENYDGSLIRMHESTMEITSTIQQERRVNILINIFTLFIIVIVVVCLMAVYKELDSEDQDLLIMSSSPEEDKKD